MLLGGAGIAVAITDPFDNDGPLSGATLAAASEAALAEVGPGTVTDAEYSDDPDHLYEVEVTLSTGVDIDVELDANFVVLRTDGAIQ